MRRAPSTSPLASLAIRWIRGCCMGAVHRGAVGWRNVGAGLLIMDTAAEVKTSWLGLSPWASG